MTLLTARGIDEQRDRPRHHGGRLMRPVGRPLFRDRKTQRGQRNRGGSPKEPGKTLWFKQIPQHRENRNDRAANNKSDKNV